MNTKKKPAKNPLPKKRTAGVEVVTISGYVGYQPRTRIVFHQQFSVNPAVAVLNAKRNTEFAAGIVAVPATLAVHIPKRRSSK